MASCSVLKKSFMLAATSRTRFLRRTYHHQENKEEKERRVSYAYGLPQDPLSCQTIGELLTEVVGEIPDKTFISFPHQRLDVSFKKLYDDSQKLAASLKQMDVSKGDRVGIWATNRYEWVVTQFATSLMGAVLVNVNPGYRARELLYCLNLVECNTLIFGQSFKSSNYSEMIDSLSPGILKSVSQTSGRISSMSDQLPHLKNLICLDVSGDEEKNTAPVNVPRFNHFIASSRDVSEKIEDASLTFDDAINIQFTSGTTGHPKAALLTHHNIVNNAYFSGKVYIPGLMNPPVICVPNPLYHCMGCVNGVMSGLLFRSHVVFPTPVPVASKILQVIDEYQCNVVHGTPTMFIDFLRENSNEKNKYSGKSMEVAIMSGAPCPPETIARIKSQVFPNCQQVLIPYGSTEISPVATMTRRDSPPEYIDSTVGIPLEHNEIKVADPETGRVLPIGVRGEVMTRGYNTFLGYYKQPEKTKEVVDDRRWYKTGDLGVMNKDGYLSITGRIKDMIIRGGENIYPREIEDVLLSFNLVSEVNVVGVPDERMGEEVAAFIVLKDSTAQDESVKDSIKSHCKANMAHFKVPKYIFFLHEFPKTATMKVQKHKLKEIASQLLIK